MKKKNVKNLIIAAYGKLVLRLIDRYMHSFKTLNHRTKIPQKIQNISDTRVETTIGAFKRSTIVTRG